MNMSTNKQKQKTTTKQTQNTERQREKKGKLVHKSVVFGIWPSPPHTPLKKRRKRKKDERKEKKRQRKKKFMLHRIKFTQKLYLVRNRERVSTILPDNGNAPRPVMGSRVARCR